MLSMITISETTKVRASKFRNESYIAPRLSWQKGSGQLKSLSVTGCRMLGAEAGRDAFVADQIRQGLPLHNQVGLAGIDQHDGGPAEAIVVAGHDEIIGSGGLYRQDIARLGRGD